MPDVPITDINGHAVSLKSLAAKQKALVVAFMSPTCPLSRKLMATLSTMEQEFAASGAAFLYVDPTASDSLTAIRGAMKEHGLDKDGDGRISKEEAGPAFEKLHALLDTNGDGFVTAEESRAALREQLERRHGS
jgi:thiol-disulfide isomerase/thioredoxin